MRDLVSMSPAAVAKVRQLERVCAALPQVALEYDHAFHAGVYARTVRVPAGVLITGTVIKIPTLVIVHGDGQIYGEGGARPLSGYTVLRAPAGRKQAFVAESDLHITMIFATEAKTVDEAEREFTDEVELLATRREQPCLE